MAGWKLTTPLTVSTTTFGMQWSLLMAKHGFCYSVVRAAFADFFAATWRGSLTPKSTKTAASATATLVASTGTRTLPDEPVGFRRNARKGVAATRA